MFRLRESVLSITVYKERQRGRCTRLNRRLDRHRAERQTSLLTSPISPGNRALSLSLFLDSYLSLPGRNRNYKRRKEPRADRSVRALTDSIREWRRWCLSNRLCSQRHATKSRRKRKREIDICVYTRLRSGK